MKALTHARRVALRVLTRYIFRASREKGSVLLEGRGDVKYSVQEPVWTLENQRNSWSLSRFMTVIQRQSLTGTTHSENPRHTGWIPEPDPWASAYNSRQRQ